MFRARVSIACVCAAACGFAATPAEAKSPKAKVRATAAAYLTAGANADASGVCKTLTEKAKQQAVSAGQALNGDVRSCEDAFEVVFSVPGGTSPSELRAAAKKARKAKVVIRGRRATLTLAGERVKLAQKGQRWLIDELV